MAFELFFDLADVDMLLFQILASQNSCEFCRRFDRPVGARPFILSCYPGFPLVTPGYFRVPLWGLGRHLAPHRRSTAA